MVVESQLGAPGVSDLGRQRAEPAVDDGADSMDFWLVARLAAHACSMRAQTELGIVRAILPLRLHADGLSQNCSSTPVVTARHHRRLPRRRGRTASRQLLVGDGERALRRAGRWLPGGRPPRAAARPAVGCAVGEAPREHPAMRLIASRILASFMTVTPAVVTPTAMSTPTGSCTTTSRLPSDSSQTSSSPAVGCSSAASVMAGRQLRSAPSSPALMISGARRHP